MTSPIAFIDTETLGLDPDVHPVWEVGIIVGDEEFCWQLPVTDRDVSLAHPAALEMTRFHERRQENLQPRGQILGGLLSVTAGCHLAGAVVSFDEERLRRAMWQEGISPRWHYHLIDVETLAVGALTARLALDHEWVAEVGGGSHAAGRQSIRTTITPPWDSEALSDLLDVDPDRFDRHTALGDARWAKAIYEAVMG